MGILRKHDLKQLAALKKCLAAGSKSIKCSTLCDCITTEIRTKLIPLAIKKEICRQMDEVQDLVNAHGWTERKLAPDLIKLFEVVENSKFNHDGYVRVQYAKFRSRFDSVKESLVAPKSFALPQSFTSKLEALRMGRPASKMPKILDLSSNRNWEQYLKQRSSTVLRNPVQHFRASGIRIYGSVYDDFEIPSLAAKANSLSETLKTVRSLSDSRLIRTKIQSIDSVLDALEIILKIDAICAINCEKISSCLLEMCKLIPNEKNDARVVPLIRELHEHALLFLRNYRGLIKINEIEEGQLKKKKDSLEMTADDVMIQKNEHFFKST
ncbi:Hypothetical protein NTJ_13916 [Nesidiocoris tenuis]|uniref:Uncharacterized protein n=1 Tax=Nesidiocoris tenuis TaxID=355587 RepID=A0ABN7B9P1_9HEMI|nr:Hypothetical protein NTJ_13916 [Nesidiocoris tenuis]